MRKNSNANSSGTDEASRLGHDLLWGARSIALELGITERAAFHGLSTGAIPGKKCGRLWVASRSRLRSHLVGIDVPAA